MTAKYTDVFTNASLGWPADLSLNMPSGGPSPPLATMGTRLRADVSDNLSLLGAVFDGNAAGPGPDDPQLRDRYGLNFRVNDPPLVLGEVQFLWNAKKGDPGLDGKFKIGGWRHFGDFTDQRFSTTGLSLADPAVRRHAGDAAGDFGVYSVFEQKLYRVGQRRRPRHRHLCARVLQPARPQPDRSLCRCRHRIRRPERPASEGQVRHRRRPMRGCRPGPARWMAISSCCGPAWPVRSSEALLTAVYQYEVRGGWTLQPNFQYIVHPGGGATNPLGQIPARR